MSFLTETLKRSREEKKKKRPLRNEHAAVSVQRFSIGVVCERSPWSESVCAVLGARLDVARPCTLRGVLLCYRVQCVTKTKSAQTLWRLNELLKCEARVLRLFCWSWFTTLRKSSCVWRSQCNELMMHCTKYDETWSKIFLLKLIEYLQEGNISRPYVCMSRVRYAAMTHYE